MCSFNPALSVCMLLEQMGQVSESLGLFEKAGVDDRPEGCADEALLVVEGVEAREKGGV